MIFLDDASQRSLRRHLEAWPEELSSGCLDWAAQRRGVGVDRIQLSRPAGTPAKEWLQLTIGSDRYLYRTGRLLRRRSRHGENSWQNVNGRLPLLTHDKHETKNLLSNLGYSTPEGSVFANAEIAAATDFFLRLGRSACVKPNRGERGNFVFARITTRSCLEAAFRRAAEKYDRILVEEDVQGDVVRFLYVAPQVTAVRVEVPANVTGDGRRSIVELIEEKNRERKERALPSHVPIILDEEAVRYLATQGFNLASVPESGCRVLLRGTSNAPSGGEIMQSPDSVHPSYVRLVESMGRAIKDLKMAGFDLVIQNRDLPATPQNYKVLEINSAPGLVVFYFPWEGQGQDVASAILDRLVSGAWRLRP